MRHRFYNTSEKAWSGMLEAMRAAERSIYLEMYIFLHDTFPTHNFFEVLARKAAQGIRVKIVIDSLGSYGVDLAEIKKLQDAGAEVLFFNQWLRRIHRKLVIIDEQVAFIGGVNIGKQYRKWLDLHMRVRGPIVKAAVRSFAHSYHKSGGTDPAVLKYDTELKLKETSLKFFEHWPGNGINPLSRYYEDRFRNAKKSITIVSPYFIPHPWLIREIEKARKRGVSIDIVLPRDTDPAIGSLASRVFVTTLVPFGVQFYFTKHMLHAKVLLIDDHEAMVGSQNIDALSFDFNAEAGVLFTEKKMVRDLIHILNEWKAGSEPYTPTMYKPAWYDWFIPTITRILQPIL